MLTFIQLIAMACKKTVTFTPAEMSAIREQVGDAVAEIGDLAADGSLVVSVGYLLDAAQALCTPAPTDLINFSKRTSAVIMLDESLLCLKVGLEQNGFKVLRHRTGSVDETFKAESLGCQIVTQNPQDLIDEAVHFDYDVIDIEDITLIDTKQDRTNQTVRKIAEAVRRSQIARRRGNWLLKILDD